MAWYNLLTTATNLGCQIPNFNAMPFSQWLLDFGCNTHITSDLSNLSVASEYNGEEYISVGSDHSLPIIHTGRGILHTSSSKFALSNLLHVPQIASSLLSVHQLCLDNNCFIIFDSDFFVVQDKSTGKILFQGPSINDLYPLHSLAALSSTGSASSCHFLLLMLELRFPLLWHNRLGHPSIYDINSVMRLLNLSIVNSLNHVCKFCLFGKMTKLHFSHSCTISHFPLELIHSDVWGPAPKISVNGYNYYASFIDDFTKYTWLFPITQKFDVPSVFMHFKPLVENIFSSTIKIFRSDGGAEFVNHTFRSYLDTHGIHHQKSSAYTPQQNGVIERKHRHIIEMVITFMIRASLLLKFLSYAFDAAVFHINHLPSSSLDNKSPFQCLFSRFPDYAHLKTFGCTFYPLLKPYNSHKLLPKTSSCVFLEYPLE